MTPRCCRTNTPAMRIACNLVSHSHQAQLRALPNSCLEIAVGSDAQPIASRTKVLAHGSDEPNPASSTGKSPVLGRVIWPIRVPAQLWQLLVDGRQHGIVLHPCHQQTAVEVVRANQSVTRAGAGKRAGINFLSFQAFPSNGIHSINRTSTGVSCVQATMSTSSSSLNPFITHTFTFTGS